MPLESPPGSRRRVKAEGVQNLSLAGGHYCCGCLESPITNQLASICQVKKKTSAGARVRTRETRLGNSVPVRCPRRPMPQTSVHLHAGTIVVKKDSEGPFILATVRVVQDGGSQHLCSARLRVLARGAVASRRGVAWRGVAWRGASCMCRCTIPTRPCAGFQPPGKPHTSGRHARPRPRSGQRSASAGPRNIVHGTASGL